MQKDKSGRNITSIFVPPWTPFTNDYGFILFKKSGATGCRGDWGGDVYNIYKPDIIYYKCICLTIDILNYWSQNFPKAERMNTNFITKECKQYFGFSFIL